MIFLFEPDRSTGDVMKMMAEDLGTHVYITNTLERALPAVKTWEFTHVFIDCWANTHDACRAILEEVAAKKYVHYRPEIIIMKQDQLPERFHDIVETYRILVKPFTLSTMAFILGKQPGQERRYDKDEKSADHRENQTVRKHH